MACLRIRFIASLGTLCAGTLVLAACAGKTLSLGTNSTQSQEVAPSQVSGAVPPCGQGSAHPNVCCTAGPNQAGSCVVYPESPFTQCDSSATTYPDPRSCCPLDGSGTCSTPPSSGGGSSGGGGGSSGGSCAYSCPPGWYTPAGAADGTCCQTDGQGNTACAGGGGGPGGGVCTGPCACPDCDSGNCPPCDCPPTACQTPPSCGACPPGWQTPQGQPDLCCMTDPSGDIECFSQAGPGGGISETADAGPSTGVACSGSGSADGAVGPCECSGQVNGHTYAVSCDSATNLCTCIVDDGAPTTSFPGNGDSCGQTSALFTACGFPAP
jgi:hypothetical protein